MDKMGTNMSRPSSNSSIHQNPDSRANSWLLKPDSSFCEEVKPSVAFGSSSPINSLPRSKPLLMGTSASESGSMSTEAPTRSSPSLWSSKPLLRRISTSDTSCPTSSSRTRPRSEQRPGKVRNLGVFGLYHHNPSGLAGFYDWKAEEGAYIPFQHQKAHRKQWRREMRKAKEEEQRERTARFTSVEEKKAARRRAYEVHLAARGDR